MRTSDTLSGSTERFLMRGAAQVTTEAAADDAARSLGWCLVTAAGRWKETVFPDSGELWLC